MHTLQFKRATNRVVECDEKRMDKITRLQMSITRNREWNKNIVEGSMKVGLEVRK